MIKTHKLQCPHCHTQLTLQQQVQPTQDLIFTWSTSIMDDERPMVAAITPDGALLLKGKDTKGVSHLISVTLGKEVPTELGPQKFKLKEIWPGVVKLSPSVADQQFHGFVTIVGAPKNWKEGI